MKEKSDECETFRLVHGRRYTTFDVPWTLNRQGAAYEDPHASIAPRRTVQCVKNARGANRTFDVARAYKAEMARTRPA